MVLLWLKMAKLTVPLFFIQLSPRVILISEKLTKSLKNNQFTGFEVDNDEVLVTT